MEPSIGDLINNYQPGDAAVEVVQSSQIALLVGIAGAGKDTIKKSLLASPGYHEIVSHTTRQPRVNSGVMEVDGREYHFIDNSMARGMLERQEFIEAKLVHGQVVYGTSVNEVKKASDSNAVALTDVDVQGVAEYKKLSQGVIALFIIPPNYDAWILRLKSRYASEEDFLAEWPKRSSSAIRELEYALSVPYFHFVLNDDLERAVRVCDEIIKRGDTYLRQDDETRLKARELLAEIRTKV